MSNLTQCSRQRRQGGQQEQVHSSPPRLLAAVPAPDLPPVPSASHPEAGLLLLLVLLGLLHAPAALPAGRLRPPLAALALAVPAAGAGRLAGPGARGQHVSGLPPGPQDGAPHRGPVHDAGGRLPLLPGPDVQPAGGAARPAAAGPHLGADGAGGRAAPLPEHGVQRRLPGRPPHLRRRLLRQVTPGDGEGAPPAPRGAARRGPAPRPRPQLPLLRPALPLRQLGSGRRPPGALLPLPATPQAQAEVQRQDRAGGGDHADVSPRAPQTQREAKKTP